MLNLAKRYSLLGVKSLDALHLALAVAAECEAFLTTDRAVLGRRDQIHETRIFDPAGFIREMC